MRLERQICVDMGVAHGFSLLPGRVESSQVESQFLYKDRRSGSRLVRLFANISYYGKLFA